MSGFGWPTADRNVRVMEPGHITAAGKRDDVKKSTAAAAANVQKGTGDAHRGGAR